MNCNEARDCGFKNLSRTECSWLIVITIFAVGKFVISLTRQFKSSRVICELRNVKSVGICKAIHLHSELARWLMAPSHRRSSTSLPTASNFSRVISSGRSASKMSRYHQIIVTAKRKMATDSGWLRRAHQRSRRQLNSNFARRAAMWQFLIRKFHPRKKSSPESHNSKLFIAKRGLIHLKTGVRGDESTGQPRCELIH